MRSNLSSIDRYSSGQIQSSVATQRYTRLQSTCKNKLLNRGRWEHYFWNQLLCTFFFFSRPGNRFGNFRGLSVYPRYTRGHVACVCVLIIYTTHTNPRLKCTKIDIIIYRSLVLQLHRETWPTTVYLPKSVVRRRRGKKNESRPIRAGNA